MDSTNTYAYDLLNIFVENSHTDLIFDCKITKVITEKV